MRWITARLADNDLKVVCDKICNITLKWKKLHGFNYPITVRKIECFKKSGGFSSYCYQARVYRYGLESAPTNIDELSEGSLLAAIKNVRGIIQNDSIPTS